MYGCKRIESRHIAYSPFFRYVGPPSSVKMVATLSLTENVLVKWV